MKKKSKIIIFIIIILLIALAILGVIFLKRDNKPSKKQNNVKLEDKLTDFEYYVNNNDSKLKKEKYKELKDILLKEVIDYDNYAKKIAEIFVVDVYDLDSKLNKYDVGGLQYVYEAEKEKLKLILQDTLYNNIEDNSLNNREQKLPKVINATAVIDENSNLTVNNKKYEAYELKVDVDYEKDLGYDKSVSVTLIKDDRKLYVVEVN